MKFRVGIVGAGNAGRNIHGKNIRARPDRFEVAAFTEPGDANATRARDEFGVPVYADLEAMLERESLDLAVVATKPHRTHAAIALTCLAKGLHTLVEKPMCMTGTEADALLGAARKSGRILTVHQSHRWKLGFRAFRQAVDRGVAGEALFFEIRLRVGEPGTDLLYNLGPHFLDEALLLGRPHGGPVTVQAAMRGARSDNTDDYGPLKAVLQFADGLMVTVSFVSETEATGTHDWYVLGTAGAFHQDWIDVPEDLFRKQQRHIGLRDRFDQDFCRFEFEGGFFYDHLYRALAEGEPLEVQPDFVACQIRVLEAVIESARTGRAVAVDLPPDR